MLEYSFNARFCLAVFRLPAHHLLCSVYTPDVVACFVRCVFVNAGGGESKSSSSVSVADVFEAMRRAVSEGAVSDWVVGQVSVRLVSRNQCCCCTRHGSDLPHLNVAFLLQVSLEDIFQLVVMKHRV